MNGLKSLAATAATESVNTTQDSATKKPALLLL